MKNLKIKSKLLITMLPLVLLPVVILVVFVNSIYRKSTLNRAKTNIAFGCGLISNQVDLMLRDMDSCSIMLNLNINYSLELLRYEISEEIKKIKFINSVEDHLYLAKTIYTDIDSISFVYKDGSTISTAENIKYNYEELQKNIDDSLGSSGYAYWIFDDKDYITLTRLVVNIEDLEELGILVLNIKKSEIEGIYKDMDSESRYLIEYNTQSVISGFTTYGTGKEEVLIYELSIPSIFGKVISTTDTYSIYSESREVTRYIILFTVLVLCISIYIINVISSLIIGPLLKLEKQMLIVRDGNMNIRSDILGSDEVGVLSSVFNGMLDRIQYLIEKIKEEQELKRKLSFDLMSSQIKPHFLYNTLDLIYIQCSMNQISEARETIKELSDFYRLVLGNGSDIVTLREEIDNVIQYLYIQEKRYGDIFSYEIYEDIDVHDIEIPKLSIQPIVENALYHGIRAGRKKGHIKIEVTSSKEEVIVAIRDDGIGMKEEILKKILDENMEKGFGIKSVNKRIKLYFGNEYGIKISSTIGIGTVVIIVIPYLVKQSL